MAFEVSLIVFELNRNQIVAEYVWRIYISRKNNSLRFRWWIWGIFLTHIKKSVGSKKFNSTKSRSQIILQPFVLSRRTAHIGDEMVCMSHLMHWDACVFLTMNAKSQLACGGPFSYAESLCMLWILSRDNSTHWGILRVFFSSLFFPLLSYPPLTPPPPHPPTLPPLHVTQWE